MNADMQTSRRALILGARSAIAQAIAGLLAAQGWDLVLAARRSAQLEPLAADLRLRTGIQVRLWEFDALDFRGLAALPERVHGECGEFELGVLVFGYLGDQEQALRDTGEMEKILEILDKLDR